jgi:hypothetical protein
VPLPYSCSLMRLSAVEKSFARISPSTGQKISSW